MEICIYIFMRWTIYLSLITMLIICFHNPKKNWCLVPEALSYIDWQLKKKVLWIKAKIAMSKSLTPAFPDWCCHAGINQKKKWFE